MLENALGMMMAGKMRRVTAPETATASPTTPELLQIGLGRLEAVVPAEHVLDRKDFAVLRRFNTRTDAADGDRRGVHEPDPERPRWPHVLVVDVLVRTSHASTYHEVPAARVWGVAG